MYSIKMLMPPIRLQRSCKDACLLNYKTEVRNEIRERIPKLN